MVRRYNSKHTLASPRRAPRFDERATQEERLPPRALPLTQREALPGYGTYYLSCDPRGLKPYLGHIRRHHQRGFRAVIVAKEGLVLEPPSVVVLGYVAGDAFVHGMAWAESNPIDEIAVEWSRNPNVSGDGQEAAQERFATATATLEALQEQRLEAEKELEEATAALLVAQGVESVCIEGVYYDVSYSREKVYLKKRDTRFMPQVVESLAAESKGTGKKRKRSTGAKSTRTARASKKRRRAA